MDFTEAELDLIAMIAWKVKRAAMRELALTTDRTEMAALAFGVASIVSLKEDRDAFMASLQMAFESQAVAKGEGSRA